MEPPFCKNIRSRRHPDQKCKNPAIHGEYCGLHYKYPNPFKSKAKISMDETPINSIVIPLNSTISVEKIQKWWRLYGRLKIFSRQGPAKWNREISVNTTDFYSMEDISTLSNKYVFSFVEHNKCVYTFDIRSLSTLLEKNEIPENPYTRVPFSEKTNTKAKKFIRWSRNKCVETRWIPIEPESPVQRLKLKVTDLFQKIDELNYYTKPDWFMNLTVDKLRCFYVELYDIWFHRAELSSDMRRTIIPPPAYPFKYPINQIVANNSLDFLRKINMDIIRMFISASPERSERTLGAMYIVTVMTLVNSECREMYPWLYESATPGIYSRYQLFTEEGPAHVANTLLTQLNTTNIDTFFNANIFLQPLLLPPPLSLITASTAPVYSPTSETDEV
jgi:hypothetical protein